MRGMSTWLSVLFVCLLAFTPGVLPAGEKHEHSKLPPGPIRERHELMEAQGQNAQDINDAFSEGVEGVNTGVIQVEAQQLAASARRIPSLFPKGSLDPNSRALPKIWEDGNWDKFVALAKQLEEQATSLSNAAGTGQAEELKEKSNKMFATCKSCHDQFRRPKDQKK